MSGFYAFEDISITTAATYLSEVIDSLEGIMALAASLRFQYGSGGTTCKVYLQTTFDQETTWVDIACLACTTASKHRVFSLQASVAAAMTTPTDASLGDDSVVNGLLGGRYRLKIVTTGTYAGSTVISARIDAK